MSGGQSQSLPEVGDSNTSNSQNWVKIENRNLIFESWHFFFESHQQVFLENFATFDFKDLMTLTSFRHLS